MKIRRERSHGVNRWLVDFGLVNGTRRREYHKTERAAKKAMADHVDLSRQAGNVWVNLDEDERLDAIRVLRLAKGRGMTLGQLWDAYLAGTAVKTTEPKTLKEALGDLTTSLIASNSRSIYVTRMEQTCGRFIKGREAMLCSHVKTADVVAYLAAMEVKPVTKHSTQKRLRTFFEFCVTHEYTGENPVAKIRLPRLDFLPPRVFSPREAAKVAVLCRRKFPRLLAWLGLAMFAGIRPDEIARLTWECVDLDRKIVVIGAAASKVRARRIVELEPAAVSWLKLAKEMKCELSAEGYYRNKFMRTVAKRLGLPRWPADICRHTAASYLLALHKDVQAVAITLGNSPGILLRHYRELVHAEDAKRFWALIPHRDWAGKRLR